MQDNDAKPPIRSEASGDADAIRGLLTQAFPSPEEAQLVDVLRAKGKTLVSLVAEIRDSIVGHILFTPLLVDRAPKSFSAAALAPVCVLPKMQRKGIGSLLITEGLEACSAVGISMVSVLGNPRFYSRFGFVRAKDHGIDNEYEADDAFMVLAFDVDTLSRVSGTAKYVPEFRELGV